MYELGLQRVREVFELEPVEFPATTKIGASGEERAKDLVAAFESNEIAAVIASLGGDDQVTYIKNLPSQPFVDNPKPFFGFSDNSHFCNFLFLNGLPSYYGASLFTQFAMQGEMDDFTVNYLKYALFEEGEFELTASPTYNDQGLSWDDKDTINQRREYWPNEGWHWDGSQDTSGRLWGGCVESVDELLRHAIAIPSLEQFENIVLLLETSEEIPPHDYVSRVVRALGERGILERINGMVVGRPKAWEFDKQRTNEQKIEYRRGQREAILSMVRTYNPDIPVIQNLDFGHTDPQIPMPYGNQIRIVSSEQQLFATF
jgi:muramoyltetrapeptide carboxypeptidase LdcA involved in peptidoglycan recycling